MSFTDIFKKYKHCDPYDTIRNQHSKIESMQNTLDSLNKQLYDTRRKSGYFMTATHQDINDAELNAEIKMLCKVLEAAGITYKTDEWFEGKAEYRTWLISQLKWVPDVIKELREKGNRIKGDD